MDRKKRRGYLLQLPICVQCGISFKRTAPAERYCSDKCRRVRVERLKEDLGHAFAGCSVQLAEQAIIDADRVQRLGIAPDTA